MRPYRWSLVIGSVLLLAVACSPEGGGDENGVRKTVFPKDRQRRILYYDAVSQQSWGYIDQGRKIPYMKLIADITDHRAFLDARTNMTFDTQVDTYVFHIGNGADPPYNISTEMLWPCFSSYEEVRDLVIEACHARGMEVWASLRMNDLHGAWRSVSIHDLDDPFKIQHPEFLLAPESSRDLASELTEHMLWAGLNFVHPEVRQHRLDFIERTAAAHDFDGYELDFNRMGISFPLGQERQNAHLLTELVREARQRLDAVGQRRGRPYTLAVHVVDSLERSQELGMEVERWVREGLVDVLLVGMGHLPSRLRLDQFVSLGRAHGVPVYATLNGNSYRAGAWEGLYGRPVFREGMRASAAYYHQEGADGFYLVQLRQRADPGAEPGGVHLGAQRTGGGGDPGGQEQGLRHSLHGTYRRTHHPGIRVGPAARGPGSGGNQACLFLSARTPTMRTPAFASASGPPRAGKTRKSG